jgi:hypothetical protein
LFGVNYGISGSLGSPTLNVNPLSAIAPGFLRKIFGTEGIAGQGSSGGAAPARAAPGFSPER